MLRALWAPTSALEWAQVLLMNVDRLCRPRMGAEHVCHFLNTLPVPDELQLVIQDPYYDLCPESAWPITSAKIGSQNSILIVLDRKTISTGGLPNHRANHQSHFATFGWSRPVWSLLLDRADFSSGALEPTLLCPSYSSMASYGPFRHRNCAPQINNLKHLTNLRMSMEPSSFDINSLPHGLRRPLEFRTAQRRRCSTRLAQPTRRATYLCVIQVNDAQASGVGVFMCRGYSEACILTYGVETPVPPMLHDTPNKGIFRLRFGYPGELGLSSLLLHVQTNIRARRILIPGINHHISIECIGHQTVPYFYGNTARKNGYIPVPSFRASGTGKPLADTFSTMMSLAARRVNQIRAAHRTKLGLLLRLLLDSGRVNIESPSRLLQPPFRKEEVCFSSVWSRLTITVKHAVTDGPVPFELSLPALIQEQSPIDRIDTDRHMIDTDSTEAIRDAHEESLLRLCFLLHVLPGYLPEAESASTLCPDNVTAIVHLHIKDLARFSTRLEEAQSQVIP
ncbi:hypothetical protein B0H17DRAFT_1236033 [Mycena rosella]|uniref:Uncharacterized protein n=1 Tax=Mycena rosella TaxID=1033263 RepID=A0AAD7D5L7_MYCRO|nr:hypothetical protein B0H17DRAFT_1236033 [Mycena rosella]